MLINSSDSNLDSRNTISSNTRKDFISGLKGRMILTLVEIAHHYPEETNHATLCKNLGIPRSTLSNQIKKLIELDYLETTISTKLLNDARYKTFRITMKGISFLNMLKDVLDSTVKRFEEIAYFDLLNERLDDNLISISL